MKHIDAHAYRTEDAEGVWEFARGNMRSYLVLKQKVKEYNNDTEVQELLREIDETSTELAELISEGYSPETMKKLRAWDLDPEALARVRLPYERLDQLVFEILAGVR